MDGDRKNWPIIIGITAGIVGGIVAGVALYAMRSGRDDTINDAQDIIDKCHDKIREIESSLERLKYPVPVS